MTATDESRMYDGIKLRNLSCPAVSHSCKRIYTTHTVYSQRWCHNLWLNFHQCRLSYQYNCK